MNLYDISRIGNLEEEKNLVKKEYLYSFWTFKVCVSSALEIHYG